MSKMPLVTPLNTFTMSAEQPQIFNCVGVPLSQAVTGRVTRYTEGRIMSLFRRRGIDLKAAPTVSFAFASGHGTLRLNTARSTRPEASASPATGGA